MNLLPKSDYCSQIQSIPVNTQENCAKTEAIPKKLKQIPKNSRIWQKKTQCTGGKSLPNLPKNREKKKPALDP